MRGRTHRKTRKNRKSGGFKPQGELAAPQGGFTCKDVQAIPKGGFTSKDVQTAAASGGFMPSVMGSFVANARMLTPLAIAAGYRLVDNAKQVRKNRVHTRSKAKSRRKRQ